MSFKPFRSIKVGPKEEITPKVINDMQYNIAQALGQVLGKDPLDLSLIKNITLYPNTINKVPHQLNRNLQGYFVVRNHGGYAVLTDYQDNNPSPNLLLYLWTPVQVTVDLLCF